MRIKSSALAIILIILFFGGIFASDLAGVWITESSKNARVIDEGTSAGQRNPADIKGSYSFSDIRNNFGISEEVLQSAFGIKNVSDISAFKCKDLETYYGTAIDKEIGTDSMRLFVALYKGIGYEVADDIYLPSAAVKILKEKDNLTEVQKEYLDKHTVEIPAQ